MCRNDIFFLLMNHARAQKKWRKWSIEWKELDSLQRWLFTGYLFCSSDGTPWQMQCKKTKAYLDWQFQHGWRVKALGAGGCWSHCVWARKPRLSTVGCLQSRISLKEWHMHSMCVHLDACVHVCVTSINNQDHPLQACAEACMPSDSRFRQWIWNWNEY